MQVVLLKMQTKNKKKYSQRESYQREMRDVFQNYEHEIYIEKKLDAKCDSKEVKEIIRQEMDAFHTCSPNDDESTA